MAGHPGDLAVTGKSRRTAQFKQALSGQELPDAVGLQWQSLGRQVGFESLY